MDIQKSPQTLSESATKQWEEITQIIEKDDSDVRYIITLKVYYPRNLKTLLRSTNWILAM
jgi:hypothetical protein